MISPVISVGPFQVHLYGAIIAISILLGWLIAKNRAHLYKIPQRIFDDPVLLVPLFLAIAGARVYHVLDYWRFYASNLNQIFAVWSGGLGIWGAIAGAVLGLWLVAKVKNIEFLKVLDLTAPSAILGQALGRVGNYINQEGFGPPTNKPWGVYIDQKHRPFQYQNDNFFHPTFFYEAILDLVFFLILIYFAKKLKAKGQLFGLYLMLYSIGRFIVEFWRIDTWVVGDVKIAHVLSIVAFATGLGIFLSGKKRA